MAFRRRALQVSALLVLAVAITAGGVVFSVRQDESDISASLLTLENLYAQRVPLALTEFFQAVGANDAVKAQIVQVNAQFKELGKSSAIQERVAAFSYALRQLRAFVSQHANNEAVTSTPSFASLRELSYGTGDIQELFADYNQHAFMWNQRDKTPSGQFIGSTLQLKKMLMVHPDGLTEEQSVISL